MEHTVESLCNLLARHKLLEAPAVRSLRQRWRSEAGGEADNVQQFGKWMVASGHVTEFQLNLLKKGSPEKLFFDQYLLQDRIGQGRMAGVYSAVHPTGQQVAIKVLPPSKANNPQFLLRFQREARMAIRLDHPNVVRTFQQGVTKSGLYYIVMEYLEGETLDDVLKRRKTISPVEAVHFGAQALEGLQHLFEEGLIHRDLKPSNLMLVPGCQQGQQDTMFHSVVKVLDIGLGRALFDEAVAQFPENVDLTAEGSILGTPNYMAPEQARSARYADIRADIYGLGCLLYETLAGQTPFAEPNFMKQILRHATEPPRPLPEISPAVPESLWAVIEVMLAKDPAQRYSTPRQAAKALKNSISAPVETPKPPEPTPKMRSYLTWLATNGATSDAPPASMTVPSSPEPPAPRPPAATQRGPVPAALTMSAQPEAKRESKPPEAAPLFQYKELKITSRDLIFLGIGAGILLVLEMILWLILRLFA